MKFLIQRAKDANLKVDGKEIAKITNGFVVLVGITHGDTTETADYLINKMMKLRIFSDEKDKMNLSILDVKGELLIVSQFTLYADCEHGNRPSFMNAAKPDEAEKLYNYIVAECKKKIENVQTGIFGADMKVSFTNDGPVTIMLEK